jgi:hypothetical protein
MKYCKNKLKKVLSSAGVCLTLSLACVTVAAHNGHGDELPWQACSEAKKNDSCEFTNSHKTLFRGNCKAFNEVLMCVRNQPLIQIEDTNLKAEDTSTKAETKSVIAKS